jgi:dimethylamine---corrinoid protein Co-methyltransferase
MPAARMEGLTIPVAYGAMPDLGRHTVPDGPAPNWSELLPLGRIEEARAAQEEAVEAAVEDICYVAEAMYEAGADGINLDTAGAAGDADFLAALRAIERIRAGHPDWPIQIGMASEFVLGMHGELEYDGVRLAGLWPAGQMRLAAKAVPPSLVRPSTSTRAGRSPGTWPAPAPSSGRARTPPRSPSTSTGGWAWAACPCTHCRRSMPSRGLRVRASTS